jgi:hypothetical protein
VFSTPPSSTRSTALQTSEASDVGLDALTFAAANALYHVENTFYSFEVGLWELIG